MICLPGIVIPPTRLTHGAPFTRPLVALGPESLTSSAQWCIKILTYSGITQLLLKIIHLDMKSLGYKILFQISNYYNFRHLAINLFGLSLHGGDKLGHMTHRYTTSYSPIPP